ncbi:MAG: CpsD/CapB family tyrosine-protein kinase [Planctomycetales bacterium]|nr:CpsD/CapB family tyrosine-protein kinase [Planctomycetales bacterium]MCA9207854.1 CpsD/CapB family tyrosine-protein kinase [Planctomycetales bacterium]MCA9224876.1 CpsD/CapB family tyrosine-protein kinase [Planctomycetales bacterium]
MLQDTARQSVSNPSPLVEWRGTDAPALRSHFAALARELHPQREGDNALAFSIGVTSCQGGEGVSTVAANLALQAAKTSDRRVLMVDANLENPGLSRQFRLAAQSGLVDCLAGRATLDECVLRLASEDSLSILPAGGCTPSEQVNCDRLDAVLDDLHENFDLLILDLPPVSELSLAVTVARRLDGVLLVISKERVTADTALRAKRRLLQNQVPLLGAVFNEYRV